MGGGGAKGGGGVEKAGGCSSQAGFSTSHFDAALAIRQNQMLTQEQVGSERQGTRVAGGKSDDPITACFDQQGEITLCSLMQQRFHWSLGLHLNTHLCSESWSR